MENKSKLIRGTSKCARFFVCDSTELVKEAKRIHGTDPVATTLFGKLLTVTAMMGKDLKGENDLITLKTNGDGPYGNMLATGNKKGEVKGYVGAIEEEKINGLINENGEFITNEQGQIRFIGDGTLQVIRTEGTICRTYTYCRRRHSRYNGSLFPDFRADKVCSCFGS